MMSHFKTATCHNYCNIKTWSQLANSLDALFLLNIQFSVNISKANYCHVSNHIPMCVPYKYELHTQCVKNTFLLQSGNIISLIISSQSILACHSDTDFCICYIFFKTKSTLQEHNVMLFFLCTPSKLLQSSKHKT